MTTPLDSFIVYIYGGLAIAILGLACYGLYELVSSVLSSLSEWRCGDYTRSAMKEWRKCFSSWAYWQEWWRRK